MTDLPQSSSLLSFPHHFRFCLPPPSQSNSASIPTSIPFPISQSSSHSTFQPSTNRFFLLHPPLIFSKSLLLSRYSLRSAFWPFRFQHFCPLLSLPVTFWPTANQEGHWRQPQFSLTFWVSSTSWTRPLLLSRFSSSNSCMFHAALQQSAWSYIDHTTFFIVSSCSHLQIRWLLLLYSSKSSSGPVRYLRPWSGFRSWQSLKQLAPKLEDSRPTKESVLYSWKEFIEQSQMFFRVQTRLCWTLLVKISFLPAVNPYIKLTPNWWSSLICTNQCYFALPVQHCWCARHLSSRFAESFSLKVINDWTFPPGL